MLILTRVSGQSVEIGDDIIFTVTSVCPTRIRLQVFGPERTIVRSGSGAQVPMMPWGATGFVADFSADLQDDCQVGPANVVLTQVMHGKQARVGVTAPKTVRIMRKEVVDRKPELKGKMPRSITEPKPEPKPEPKLEAQPSLSPEELERQELLRRYGFSEAQQ